MIQKDSLHLPSALRRLREQAGLSQLQVAASLGVQSARICELERGRKIGADPGFLGAIARALELTVPDRDELVRAGLHDRALYAMAKLRGPQRLRLISAAIHAADNLDDGEEEIAARFIDALTHRSLAAAQLQRYLTPKKETA